MRILVIVLLIINLLVFGIGTYYDDIAPFIEQLIEPKTQENPPLPSNEDTILDTPVESASTPETANNTSEPTSVDTPATVTDSASPADTANVPLPSFKEATPAAPSTVSQPAAVTSTHPQGTPSSEEKTGRQPDNTTNSDQTSSASIAAAPAPLANQVPQAQTVKRLACVEIGPISKTKMNELRKIIGTLPKDSTVRTYAKASNLGPFWVYLPAARNLEEQQAQIAMLKQKGIHDYFIVQNAGQEKGAVSLGVFKSQELAKNLQKRLVDQGIPARIGQKTSDMSYVRITQAPDTIRNKYRIIRRKFPTVHTLGSCQP